MSYSREQVTSHQEEKQMCEVPTQTGQNTTAMSNSQALEQLAGTTQPQTAVDLSSAQDGPSFATAASKALDAVVPGPGSNASLRISGKLPIYTTGAINAFLMPALSLSALRLSNDKLKVTIDSELGLRAEAGTGGSRWWPKFLAYFQGKIKGTIRIVGDDALEIFDELLLTFRMIIEKACEAADAPDSITEAMAGAIMSGESKDQTIENMDGSDSVETLLGGEIEAGADTSFGSSKVKAALQQSTKLSKDLDSNSLQVTKYNRTTAAVEANINIPKLGASSTVGVNFIWKDGVFDEWWVSANLSKTMALGEFSEEVLIAADWIQELVNSISNAVAMSSNKTNEPSIRDAANMLNGISVADNAIQYTAFGDGLRTAAGSDLFQEKSGQSVSFSIMGRAGWSKSKGINLLVMLDSSSSWSLGEAGVSPIQIDVKTGDTILHFTAGTEKGMAVQSGW